MNSKPSKWRTRIITLIILIPIILLLKIYLENEWDKFEAEENKTGKTIICKTAFDIMANNTYMIISKSGKVVVMDPYDVYRGPKPDLITVSHLHGDHYDEEYISRMNCRKSISKVESIEMEGIKMISLPSSHDSFGIDTLNPSNVIYCVTIDSMKIAHLGDYAQTKLTAEQIAVLKGIDILIMPCAYYPITVQSINNIIEELHPPVIFTTHKDNERLEFLKKHISENVILKEKFSINKAEINKSSIKLVTLERNNLSLLFARYLVYKFTGSNLFKYIILLIVLIIGIRIYFKRRKNKSINKHVKNEIT